MLDGDTIGRRVLFGQGVLEMKAIDTREQLVELLDQLIFDVDELLACAADEFDDQLEPFAADYGDIGGRLRTLKNALQSCDVEPGTGEDQPWIARARVIRRHLPVYGALESVNRVMREGFGADLYGVNPNAG